MGHHWWALLCLTEKNVSPYNLVYASLIKQKNFYEKTGPGFCHSYLLKGHVPAAAL